VGGIAVVYTGYGYNAFPEYTASYPPSTWNDKYDALGDSLTPGPPNDLNAVSTIVPPSQPSQVGDWGRYYDYANKGAGKWYKMGNYTRPGERALLGDCRAYVLEAVKSAGGGNFCGQATVNALSNVGQTSTFWTSFTQSP